MSTLKSVPPQTGPAGPAIIGGPVTRTLSFATAYQATDPAKAAFVTALIDLAGSVSIGTVANTVEMITGPTNAVAGGTGTLADSWRNDITITLITLTITSRQKLTCNLPVGYYFAIRRTVGTGMSISSAFDQALG